MSDPKIIPQNFVNCKYFDTNQMQNLKTCKDKRSLSFIHLTTCFLPKNFDNSQYLIQSANVGFDVTAISQSIIIKIHTQ